jgi:repressor LexA
MRFYDESPSSLTYQTFVWYVRDMPITPPGETRERVLQYVRERLLDGRPPTIREVQGAFRFRAVETARAHLDALVREGRLQKREGEARGFELPSPQSMPRLVPVLGRVQAGALSTAVEDLEGYVAFDGRSAGAARDVFALRVHGESMTGAGILPRDLVLVRKQETARSGEIVVALVEDEATVKRLRIRVRKIELHPENPAFAVIVPPRGGCTILGKVIEVRRSLE